MARKVQEATKERPAVALLEACAERGPAQPTIDLGRYSETDREGGRRYGLRWEPSCYHCASHRVASRRRQRQVVQPTCRASRQGVGGARPPEGGRVGADFLRRPRGAGSEKILRLAPRESDAGSGRAPDRARLFVG